MPVSALAHPSGWYCYFDLPCVLRQGIEGRLRATTPLTSWRLWLRVCNEGDRMSVGEGSGTTYRTDRSRDWPSIRQFSVFLENRVGQLLDVVKRFQKTKVRIVALSIIDSADCAIVRLVLSHPEQGREILERAGLAIAESDLVAVELPATDQPLVEICTALLQAEINIHYAYPMMIHPHGRAAIALHVDNHELAVETLKRISFNVLTEADLTSSF